MHQDYDNNDHDGLEEEELSKALEELIQLGFARRDPRGESLLSVYKHTISRHRAGLLLSSWGLGIEGQCAGPE